MKLVCINNINENLTIGKIYNILAFDNVDFYYKIINDNNIISWYYYNRFLTLKEYRKEKLIKLDGIKY